MNAIIVNKRKRASSGRLAKQKIRAYSSIFLLQTANETSSTRNYTGTLDGKIVTCPKREDQFWTIKWSSNSTSSNETIPPNQLRKIIENTKENKKLLLDAVVLPSGTSNSSASNTATVILSDTNATTTTTDTIDINQNRTTITATTPNPNPNPTLNPTNANATTTNEPAHTNDNHTTTVAENSTPQRDSVHARFTSICGNISQTSQTTPVNTQESIQHSFWEFESDPDGWVNRNRSDRHHTSTSLTSLLEGEAIIDDNASTLSLSSGEDDIPNVEFSLPDEASFVPREPTDEFPEHEADDALVDEIQEELEREVNLPNLPFKFEEWDEEKHTLDEPPVMSPVQTVFRPDFNHTIAFLSTKNCFNHITGLDLQFFYI